MFSENCYCSMNLVFYVFFVFLRKKKKEQNVFSVFFLFSLFKKKKTVFKNRKQTYLYILRNILVPS